MGGLLFQAFVYLCAAVIAVPIAKRLGLGSVLQLQLGESDAHADDVRQIIPGVSVTGTVMVSLDDRIALAEHVLAQG